MHKTLSTALFLSLASVSLNSFGDSDKQEICHKGKEISVAQSAVAGHMKHGDTEGSCDDQEQGAGDKPTGKDVVVVMMRCDAVGTEVEVVSASSSVDLSEDLAVILPIPPVADLNCAKALAGLLNADFKLRSVNSGSAGVGGDLNLYTDYLLIGQMPSDDS